MLQTLQTKKPHSDSKKRKESVEEDPSEAEDEDENEDGPVEDAEVEEDENGDGRFLLSMIQCKDIIWTIHFSRLKLLSYITILNGSYFLLTKF